MPQLYCPSCKSELAVTKNGAVCEVCEASYDRKYGILSFVDDRYSYGNIPQKTWEEVFFSITGKTNEEILSYLASKKFKGRWAYFNSFKNNKADGFSFLDVSKNDVILDIGCGPGSLTIPLAKKCKEVYALDATLPRLRFLEIRRQNEGLDNVIPIHASAVSLPFQGGCFDYILMNGVFEYIGEWDDSADPKKTQENTLQAIYGLLKKGGHIFIAIENRYGFDYVYKEKDHSKLYATNLLPRIAANWVTMALKKKRYRIYTHSFNDYNKMLEEAGFRSINFYYVWPDYRDPKFIFAERDRNIFKYYLEHFIKHQAGKVKYSFFRMAYKFGVERHFVSNFIIVGKK
jgi:ubiquinone/menaquinone biosynthesis C-methylase UbiE